MDVVIAKLSKKKKIDLLLAMISLHGFRYPVSVSGSNV